MKLVTLYIVALIFLPAFAMAQETASKENVPSSPSELAFAPQSTTDGFQHVPSAAFVNNSTVELNALYARSNVMAAPDLYTEINQADRIDRSDTGIIGAWRERLFKTLRMYCNPRQSGPVDDNRLQSNDELDEPANANRMVTRIVLKETLKFTQERLPEIDKLVKILKFEISTNAVPEEDTEAEAGDNKTAETRAAHTPLAKNKLFLKTGLRVPVESRKVSLISETEAVYSNLSSFVKVNLDGQHDHSVGLAYALGSDTHLQVERQVTHTTTGPGTGDKTNLNASINLIQVVRKF